MKILLITDLYPLKNNHKGIPKAIENFAIALQDLGHKIYVLRADLIINTLLRGRKTFKQGEYCHNGIKIYNQNFLMPFYFNPKIPNDFDVIVSHMPSGTLCAAGIKNKFKKPHVAICHSSDIEVLEKYKIYFSKALNNALKNADAIGARSHWIKNKLPFKNVFLAPSGIKKEEITKKTFNEKELKIICASSLIKRKNIKSLILAMKEFDDISLEIFGSGNEEKKLKKLAKDINVKFMGQKPRENVLEALEEARIFILPSKKETFGLSYLEALAKGCIVICTKNSGMDGFIKNGLNGFITESNSKNIANTIKKVLSLNKDELNKISDNAKKLAQQLEYYECAKNYLENIKKVCK